MNDIIQLWQSFQTFFFNRLKSVDPQALLASWSNKTERTAMYARVLEDISTNLELEVEREFLAIDFVLKKPGTGVPWIAIESENDVWDTDREISKLCSVAAPLRILLTVSEWDSQLGGWQHSGQKHQYLPKWSNAISMRLSVWPHPGSMGFLVGERGRDDQTRFYSYLIASDSKLIDKAEPAVTIAGLKTNLNSQMGHGG